MPTLAWSDVQASPEFRALPAADKEAARNQYFDQVVAPNLDAVDLDEARRQFDAQTRTREVGLGEAAVRGAGQGGLDLMRGLGILAAGIPARVATAMGRPDIADNLFSAADDFGRWGQEKFGEKPNEHFSEPAKGARVVGGAVPALAGMAMAGPAAGAVVAGGGSGASTYAANLEQGVDSGTALAQAGNTAAQNTLGLLVPAAIPGKLATRVATGGGINAVLAEIERVVSNAIYGDEYKDLQREQSLGELAGEAVVGGVTGGAFGPRPGQPAFELGLPRRRAPDGQAPDTVAAPATIDEAAQGQGFRPAEVDGERGFVTPSGAFVTAERWDNASPAIRATWMLPAETGMAGPGDTAKADPIPVGEATEVPRETKPEESKQARVPAGEARELDGADLDALAPTDREIELVRLREETQDAGARAELDKLIKVEQKKAADMARGREFAALAERTADPELKADLLGRARKLGMRGPEPVPAPEAIERTDLDAADIAIPHDTYADGPSKPGGKPEVEAPAKAAPTREKKGTGNLLLRELRKAGGLHTALAAEVTDKGFRANAGRMSGVFRKRGMREDALAEWMHERGYITDAEFADFGGVTRALDLLAQAARGEDVVPVGSLNDRARQRMALEAEDAMRREAEGRGISTEGLDAVGIEAKLADDDEMRWRLRHDARGPDALTHAQDVADAMEIDAARVERAAIQHENDDTAFRAAILDILASQVGETQRPYRSSPRPDAPDAPAAQGRPQGRAGDGAGPDGGQPRADGAAAARAQRGAADPAAGPQGADPARVARQDEADLFGTAPRKGLADLNTAKAKREAAAAAARRAAPPPEDFELTGSDRPADVGAAAGQRDMFDVPEGKGRAVSPGGLDFVAAGPKVVDISRAREGLRTFGRTARNVTMQTIRVPSTPVKDARAAAAVLAPMRRSAQEQFLALVLDANDKPLAVLRHTRGEAGSVTIIPGLVAGGIGHVQGAKSVWFSHNHPSGSPDPSSADVTLQSSMNAMLRDSGIEVRGHIIMTPGRQATDIGPGGVLNNAADRKVPVLRNLSLPVVENTQMGRGEEMSAANIIDSPASAKDAARKFFGTDKSGVLLLDGQLKVKAALEMTPAEMARLRTGDPSTGFNKLMSAAMHAGAARAIVVVNGHPDAAPGRNVGTAMRHISGVLDIIHDGKSAADLGADLRNPGEFASEPGKPSPGAHTSAEHLGQTLRAHFGAKLIDALEAQGLLRIEQAPADRTARATFRERGADSSASLYWDRIRPEDGPAILMHELGEHFGMPRLLGETRYRELLLDLQAAHREGDADVRAAWQTVGDNYPGLQKGGAQFMREVAAHLVEAAPKQHLVRRLLNDIRAFFYRQFGTALGNRVDANLLRGLAAAALRKAAAGDLPGEWFDGATEAARRGEASSMDTPLDDKMLAQHNLTEENLLFADRLGGLPAPSVAVSKVGAPAEGFGDIKLIGRRDLVDPSQGTPVFDADVWSARYPEVQRKPQLSKRREAAWKKLRPMFEEIGEYTSEIADYFYNTKNNDRKLRELLQRSSAVMRTFLQERGVEAPPPATRELVTDGPVMDPAVREWMKANREAVRIADDLPWEERRSAPIWREFTTALRRHYEAIYARDKEMEPEIQRMLVDSSMKQFEDEDGPHTNRLDALYRKLAEFGKRELSAYEDQRAVEGVLKERGLLQEFNQWTESIIDEVHGDRTITLGRKQVPMTLDNVVEAMTSTRIKGREDALTFGLGKTRAMLAKRFKSIPEIQKARGQILGREQLKAIQAEIEKAQTEARMLIDGTAKSRREDFRGTFDRLDDAQRALADIGGGKSVETAMRRNGFDPSLLDDDEIAQVREAAIMMRGAAVEYFEAKPQRAVGLNEFKAAVVRNTISPQARAVLDKHGIRIFEHDGSREDAARVFREASQAADDGDVLFSQPPRSEARGGRGPDYGALGQETTAQRFERMLFNRFNRVGLAQDKAGVARAGEADIAGADALYAGRVQHQGDVFERDFVKPLSKMLQAAAKVGVTVKDADEFLMALHAPERNRVIAARNPGMPDGGSGLTNQQAGAILARFKPEQRQQLDAIAKFVHQMNREKLDRMVDAGLITADARDGLNAQYRYYVPLKNLDAEDAHRGIGRGYEMRANDIQSALGRSTKAGSPLAASIMDASRAIVRSEKARVDRTIWEFANTPEAADFMRVYDPENPPAEVMGRKIGPDGQVTAVVDSQKVQDMTVSIVVDGEARRVFVPDQLLRDQLRKVGSANDPGPVLRWIGKGTSTVGRLLTEFNPSFTLPNGVRDAIAAAMRAPAHGVTGAELLKAMPSSWAAIVAHKRGKNTADARLYEEFLQHGGKTGAYGMLDLVDTMARFEKEGAALGYADMKGGPVRPLINRLGSVARAVSSANEVIEYASRFSLYRKLRAKGQSPKQAALASKEITVNFNRSGEYGRTMNSLLVFANAALQGLYGTVNYAKNKKVQRNMLALVALGAAVQAWNEDMGGDNDATGEPNSETQHDAIQDRNVVVLMPDSSSGFKIPLPPEYAALYAMGRRLWRLGSQGNVSREAGGIVGNILDSTLPVRLPEAGSWAEQGFTSIVPTLAQPFAQLLMTNRNHFGQPIVAERPYDKSPPPYFTTARRDTSEIARAFSEWANSATGGDDIEPGWSQTVAGPVIAPEGIEHIVGFYTGGLGQFVMQSKNLVSGTMDDTRALDPNKIPMSNRFIFAEPRGYISRRYAELQPRLEYEAARTKRGEATKDEKAGRALGEFARAERTLRRLAKDMRAASDQRQRDDIAEQMRAAKARVLRAYSGHALQ